VERYVLSSFGDPALACFNDQLSSVVEAIELFIEQGVDVCMNRMNGHVV